MSRGPGALEPDRGLRPSPEVRRPVAGHDALRTPITVESMVRRAVGNQGLRHLEQVPGRGPGVPVAPRRGPRERNAEAAEAGRRAPPSLGATTPTPTRSPLADDEGRAIPGDLHRAALGLTPIQSALMVGRSDDAVEAAADALADRAVALPTAPTVDASPITGHAGGDAAPASAYLALNGPGRPLDDASHAFFEPRFGHDFSAVRVYSDADASRSARDLGARAYTAGSRIVFAAKQHPATGEGRRLLAHELAHVIQQERAGSTWVQRQPDPRSPAKLADPISGYELPGFGFFAIGDDFSGSPTEFDVRQILIDTGLADAKTLNECTVRIFQPNTMEPYFAYVHPTLGVVARARAGISGRSQNGGGVTYGVFAFIDGVNAAKYRPIGGTGRTRVPSEALEPIAGVPSLSFSELHAKLRILEARLAILQKRFPVTPKGMGAAVPKALAAVAALRNSLVATTEQARVIDTAVQVLEWVEHDLDLMETLRVKLLAGRASVSSIRYLIARQYAVVVENLTEPDVVAAYETAQLWAERLPLDLQLEELGAHGELNKDLLKPSQRLVDWSNSLRRRLDAFYTKRGQAGQTPGNVAQARELETEAAFLEAAVRGIQLFSQWLVAFESMLRNRPGVLDTPLIDAMNRLRDHVHAIKDAYDRHDPKDLKARVDSLEADPAVRRFYTALPAAMQITTMVGKIGVTTLAALATGGVGGLLAGGARAAATGITLSRALGTAVLEAATFTVVNASGHALVFGDKFTFGSLLRDFAWNLGLFIVLRGVSGVSGSILRAAELQALSAPVQLTAGFPVAHGWGLLRFRWEQNRWPTKDELDRMTAESVLMLAAIALGSSTTQRWVQAHRKAGQLSTLYREYGWQFQAIETLRSELGQRLRRAEAAGKGNDKAELDAARTTAETLEKHSQSLLEAILKDQRFDAAKIRAELNALRTVAPDIAAELISQTLGVPADVGLRRAGSAIYTFEYGKISALEDALAGRYRVTKTIDPRTGMRTVEATSADAPTLRFQERSAALDFDTGLYDFQKLALDLRVKSVAGQRMLWRFLDDAGVKVNATQATGATRAKVRALVKRTGKDADHALSELYATGEARSGAAPALVQAADRLESSGILRSAEWLEARTPENQRGVVGEWLAREAVPAGSGSRVLRRVTVQGDLFEDPAGLVPAKRPGGQPRTNVTVAETDLVHVRSTGGTTEVETILSVKTSAEKGMAASARVQNANFEAILRAQTGDLVRLTLAEGVRYARVRSITALEGEQLVTLTGRLTPASSMKAEIIGPKGGGGFTTSMTQDTKGLSRIAEILWQTQLIRSGEY